MRIRLIGGRISATGLRALSAVAREFGDGDLHPTGRANLQLRALPHTDGVLPEQVVEAIEATGLLPSRRHDLARNVMVSPGTGRFGGRADLRPLATALDDALLADERLGDLPGRFLFTLDDGRGDLAEAATDLGLVCLDGATVQLRVGERWGSVLPLTSAVPTLLGLARLFLLVRGTGETAAWHVGELPTPLSEERPRDPRAVVHGAPLPFGGPAPGWRHLAAPVLTPDLVDDLTADPDTELIVTPWRGVLMEDR